MNLAFVARISENANLFATVDEEEATVDVGKALCLLDVSY